MSAGSREEVLGRIREALRVPAPRLHERAPIAPAQAKTTTEFRQWMPTVGDTIEEQIELFAKASEGLKTEFHQFNDLNSAGEFLAKLAAENGWKRVALHSAALTDAVTAPLSESIDRLRTDDGYVKTELESCDAGITECEALVAQIGSVCVTAKSSGGRALSVLPPHHVVVARRSQMVRDLSAAYEHLAAKYSGNYPSFVGFITGPSRTGDIERILVLGAHGPKRLTVLLVND
ncbi:MAG: LutC/YkgG family protein [Chthoniobacteraceae bacterium]